MLAALFRKLLALEFCLCWRSIHSSFFFLTLIVLSKCSLFIFLTISFHDRTQVCWVARVMSEFLLL